MLHTLLLVGVAWSATTFKPASPIYVSPPAVAITITASGGMVNASLKLKDLTQPVTYVWSVPSAYRLDISRTLTAKGADKLSGHSVPITGPGRYSVWVYDDKGRYPLAHAALVIQP